MAPPQLPDFPDDDPVAALRMLRDYLRDIVVYLSPFRIVPAILFLSVLAWFFIRYTVGSESVLSWAADLVPLSMAVISIIVTIILAVKKVREEHLPFTIVLMIILGIAGTAIMHESRIYDQSTHQREVEDLRKRMDSVREQNNNFLTVFLTKPPLTSQEAELQRRANIEKALRGDYILSHDNISPGLLAGTDFPPSDWMNKRLHELGEKWTIAANPVKLREPSSVPEEAQVFMNVAVGSDDAQGILSYLSGDPHIKCAPPFACYAEDQTLPGPIELDFTGKTRRRVFLAVANISKVTLQKYKIVVTLVSLDPNLKVQGLSIYSPELPRANSSNVGVEWKENEVADIFPISRSKSVTDFIIDVEAREDSTLDFRLNFRITAANLTVHTISVPFHIIRTTGLR